VREENTEIMRWWSKVVATELAKIDEDIKVNITAAAAADKILELEQVLTSISTMREKLQEAVDVLREALQKVERPDSLLQLGIQKADMLDLSTEELPLTLRSRTTCNIGAKFVFVYIVHDLLDFDTNLHYCHFRLQVEGWAGTRDKIYREKISTLVKAVGEINNIK